MSESSKDSTTAPAQPTQKTGCNCHLWIGLMVLVLLLTTLGIYLVGAINLQKPFPVPSANPVVRPSASASCRPRPACLDREPRCLMPITEDMCPPASPTNSQDYTCPETEYVDCMPGPGAVNPECDPEFLIWAQENCPNFKGAAY